MEIPPFPDKEDVLKKFTINYMYVMCALSVLMIIMCFIFHDIQWPKSKAVALVLMQVVMISPYILWDEMVSPHMHSMTGLVVMNGYYSWIRYLWCWHDFGYPLQIFFAVAGLVYFLMYNEYKIMPSEKSVYSCLTPFFQTFIAYLDNDMKKSVTDHLVAKTPVFFLMLFFRLCENVLYGHIIPVMCTSALFYLPYHFVSHMISKQATKKSKSKK